MKSLTYLRQKYPKFRAEIAAIADLRSVIQKLPLPTFFEPVSVVIIEGGKRSLASVDAEIVTAWAHHVANSAMVRMRLLEEGTLEQLTERNLLSGMALIRSHMESAGFAAYAESQVVACADMNSWEPLKEIIVKMLFGTSFRLEREHEEIQDFLTLTASEPIRIRRAIEAMDGFLESTSGQPTRYFRGVYALLCEYAHPSIGSVKGFAKVTRQGEAGWSHTYSYRKRMGAAEVEMALTILLRNMRIGYANAMLLLSGAFENTPHGIVYHKPPMDIAQAIWKLILQQD